MIVGYARVSTRDQDLTSQIAELQSAGCAKVYAEKISGAKTDRVELQKLLRRLQAGDTLIVCRLDRRQSRREPGRAGAATRQMRQGAARSKPLERDRQPRKRAGRSVIAFTVASTWKPNSSGTSAALRCIQNVRSPAETAATPSQLFAEIKPSSGLLT